MLFAGELQNKVWIQERGNRIISLKPNITEILFKLGVGAQIVGVTQFCDDPPEAQKIDKVSDYVHIFIEKVLAKKPTLVIDSQENSIKKEVEFLKDRGLRVKILPFERLADIAPSIRTIARDLGIEEKGRELALEFENELSRLIATPSLTLPPQGEGWNKREPRILIVVGLKPLVVVGGQNLLDDLLKMLHLQNVAGASRLRYPHFSEEQLIAANPDIIVDLSMGREAVRIRQNRKYYSRFFFLRAVKENRVYFMDVEDFRPSPRLIEGARKLVELCH